MHRTAAHASPAFIAAIVTASAFIFWKSPAVDPLIRLWNASAWPTIGRTQDWSDLLPVLLTLPRAIEEVRPRVPLRQMATVAVALSACFAFVATTMIRDIACCQGKLVFLHAA